MSRIKCKNSVAELLLRKAVYEQGLRYRIHNNRIIGKPDISISKYKIAVFVDGDWWHGRFYSKEKSKYSVFWRDKIQGNINRDLIVNKKLKSEGWKIFRFWQKEIEKDSQSPALRIKEFVESRKHCCDLK